MLAKPYTIAIVDDDDDIREVLEDICSEYFLPEVLRVISFNSAADGLKYMKQNNNIHIMTLDLEMESENGEMVIPNFLEEVPYLKIVIISGNVKLIPKWLCFKKGADKYLAKPFDEDEFVSIIKNYIEELDKWLEIISNN